MGNTELPMMQSLVRVLILNRLTKSLVSHIVKLALILERMELVAKQVLGFVHDPNMNFTVQ